MSNASLSILISCNYSTALRSQTASFQRKGAKMQRPQSIHIKPFTLRSLRFCVFALETFYLYLRSYHFIGNLAIQTNQYGPKQWDGRSHLNGIAMCQSGGAYQPLQQTGASDMKITTLGIDLA
ncbi:MAG: hypothetical protein WBK51_04950, partial [Polaromonas sp.]